MCGRGEEPVSMGVLVSGVLVRFITAVPAVWMSIIFMLAVGVVVVSSGVVVGFLGGEVES